MGICLLFASCWLVGIWHISRSWRLRRHVPPKGRLTFSRLLGRISQKTELFITTVWEPQIVYVYFSVDTRFSQKSPGLFLTPFHKKSEHLAGTGLVIHQMCIMSIVLTLRRYMSDSYAKRRYVKSYKLTAQSWYCSNSLGAIWWSAPLSILANVN
jgi:hypothetical protein